MKKKYILVSFPESQVIIDHPRFNECHLIDSGDNNSESNTYAVPEDLYEEVYGKREFRVGEVFSFGLKRFKVVVGNDCKHCVFYANDICIHLRKYIGHCVDKNRSDNVSISFVEYKD